MGISSLRKRALLTGCGVSSAKILHDAHQADLKRRGAKDAPKIQLTPCTSMTERDEQKGYRFLFAGAAVGIRNRAEGERKKASERPEVR
jgi:hypothetical protein